LLWRAEPVRAWHLTGVAVHVLLGISNLVFWQIFVAADMLLVGYLTTSLHGLFVVLQLLAAHAAGPGASAHSSLVALEIISTSWPAAGMEIMARTFSAA
jgi:hypothetical protein